MTEQEFQRYWVEEHAVRFASKIPQIRKYLVDTRVSQPSDTGDPLWCGVAEIWLANEKEQLDSLQTKEFLQGARLDEPSWAAFWRTVVLDTTADELMPGLDAAPDGATVKLLVLSKRKEGLALESFRSHMLETHAATVLALPGLRRYVQGHVRDGAYAVGEALLDCVEQLWFDDLDSLNAAQQSAQQQAVNADYRICAETRYVHEMVVQEHWVIGPEPRDYTDATS